MGKHRMPRKPTTLNRTIGGGLVVGGMALSAVALTGATDSATANAKPFSVNNQNGNGNVHQTNFLSNNVITPQFGLLGANSSANIITGNAAAGNGALNLTTSQLQSNGGTGGLLSFGNQNGNGNVSQVNILSNNVINPQFSLLGANLSTNAITVNLAGANGVGNVTGTQAQGN